jgi:hypothetical protein
MKTIKVGSRSRSNERLKSLLTEELESWFAHEFQCIKIPTSEMFRCVIDGFIFFTTNLKTNWIGKFHFSPISIAPNNHFSYCFPGSHPSMRFSIKCLNFKLPWRRKMKLNPTELWLWLGNGYEWSIKKSKSQGNANWISVKKPSKIFVSFALKMRWS